MYRVSHFYDKYQNGYIPINVNYMGIFFCLDTSNRVSVRCKRSIITTEDSPSRKSLVPSMRPYKGYRLLSKKGILIEKYPSINTSNQLCLQEINDSFTRILKSKHQITNNHSPPDIGVS